MSAALAVGEVQGPAVALALVNELGLDNYHSFHATTRRPAMRPGRHDEAAAAYGAAAAMAPTDAEWDSPGLGGRAPRGTGYPPDGLQAE